MMESTMKKATVLVGLIILCAASSAHALWLEAPCSQGGVWPKNWPNELEPLRKQSRQLVAAGVGQPNAPPATHTISRFEIPFADREQFESAWPHIVTLKNAGVPLTLLPVTDVRVQTGNTVRIDKTSGIRILVSTPITPADPKAADRALHALCTPSITRRHSGPRSCQSTLPGLSWWLMEMLLI